MDGGVVVAYVVSYLLGGLTRLVDRELDDGLTRLFNAVKSKVQGEPAWCGGCLGFRGTSVAAHDL